MKFKILFDNYPYNESLKSLWGFSCVIELNYKKILFDTGSNGRFLLKNAKQMGINFKEIDTVFISHNHWDHIGGLDTVIEENPNIELIIPNTLSKHLINDLKPLVEKLTIIEEEFKEIELNIYSTGMIGNDIKEQSLIIKDKNELYIISGCGHPQINNIEKRAREYLQKPVKYIIGGFHLMNKNPREIQKIISELKSEYITATHCTGEIGIGMLKVQYKNKFLGGGVGREIIF